MSGTASKVGFWRGALGAFRPVDEREFLPAALEVVETPPSPTGRALGLIIVLFFTVAVAWAVFGRVDILATAPGRVLPAGQTKIIQPLDPGIVRAIHVEDGQHVIVGQLLIELDPTQPTADRDRLVRDLMQAKLDVARLTALAEAVNTGRAPRLTPPADATHEQIEQTAAAMRARADAQAAKLADLNQQIEGKRAEAREVGATINEINASIPMLAEKERIHRQLTEQGYGTSLTYLDAQQQLSNARRELLVQAERRDEANASRAGLERQVDGARSQYAADILTDLSKAKEQVNEMGQDLVKARDRAAQTELRSPITGVIDQLAVHTLGGVVTPAEHLMIVVPDRRELMIEARLSNRDVGFVHAGQAVKVKVETFNFTRYGLIDGHVLDVSHDVISTEPDRQPDSRTPDDNQSTNKENSPSYVARVLLSKTSMVVDGREEPLQPGMAVTVEIKTGRRTIMDYLLSPLARRAQESLHER